MVDLPVYTSYMDQQNQQSASIDLKTGLLWEGYGEVHKCLPALERRLGILAGTGRW